MLWHPYPREGDPVLTEEETGFSPRAGTETVAKIKIHYPDGNDEILNILI
jgi:hypothetical protein